MWPLKYGYSLIYFGKRSNEFSNYSGPDSILQFDGHTISGTISDRVLQGSKFHYDYNQKSLFHFTSLNNAKSILDSETLWVSNFNSFRDKKEFIHAAEHIFNIDEPDALSLKNGLFALSLTEANLPELYNEPYEYHWQNYANSYRGVALEFEIKRHPLPPDFYSSLPPDFYSLRVQYQNSHQNEDFLNNLRHTYYKYFGNSNLNNNVIEFLLPIFCAYKLKDSDTENYSLEKEVRLLFSESDYYKRSQ